MKRTPLKSYTPLYARTLNTLKRGGTAMSPKVRKEVGTRSTGFCSFRDVQHPSGPCEGRITREHALTFAGKKIQLPFAIIDCCAKHHAVDSFQDAETMVKEMNIWVALNQATDEELLSISKAVDYIRERGRLNAIYGPWTRPVRLY